MTNGSIARIAALLLLIAAIAVLVFALRSHETPQAAAPVTAPAPVEAPAPVAQQPAAPVARPEEPVAAAPAHDPSALGTLAERLADAQQAVVAARAERVRALAELSAAEAELEPREQEIAELERYIADLEARGEDPAEHPEEGLKLFNPALENYQRTALRLEQAQLAVDAADEGLAKAEQALSELSPSGAGLASDPKPN